jgi:protein involved in polysaccharide export with SLBB domain
MTESDQRVEVVFVVRQATPAAGAPAPDMAPPAAAAIENSEILTVTVDDPANPTTTNVRVAEDGTVEVPLAGKVKAVGKTTTQLETDIEARWRESKAGVAPGTKAKVVRPADDPVATPPLDLAPAKQ